MRQASDGHFLCRGPTSAMHNDWKASNQEICTCPVTAYTNPTSPRAMVVQGHRHSPVAHSQLPLAAVKRLCASKQSLALLATSARAV